MSLASPSAKNRTLGEENLPRVLHSGKNCTRGREAFSSAAEILALGKEQHSRKALFPECNTRGEDRHSAKKRVTGRSTPPMPLKLKKNSSPSVFPGTRRRGPFPSARIGHSGKRLPSPSALFWHSGKGLFPECQGRHSGKNFFFKF